MTTPDLPTSSASSPSPSASVPPSRDAMDPALPQQRVDDEPLRLVTSFNDVFVVVAAWLLSFGTGWLTTSLPATLQMLLSAAITWGLSEIFVRRRRMALPALCFSFGFISAVAMIGFGNASLVTHDISGVRQSMSWFTLGGTAIFTAAGAALYWWRFRVPVAIAFGVAGIVATTWFHILVLRENFIEWILVASVIVGLAIFAWALRWDAQDPQRVTIRSDVAFWLHLVAACMVTHPIFWTLMPEHPIAAIAVFLVLTVVSLVIDRRALMLSSLLYVISAIMKVLVTASDANGLPVVAVVVGAALLLLSVFWQPSRAVALRCVPAGWRAKLPR
ncbi:hypothetical protein PIN31115_00903 [Pandoraea iniqua]|uniref:DUF2157 domain-containing protein n=1 Tax=Pandoraea iniqua TaxID=2508288 RepID=A0A5E4SM10_9BURK|nr:hypothetical protein [Pandoraea iniqua]VVD76777.1 hypothetical protein PIN31115_00903 [Pandoraea iniqua]